jgi:hypothetical protein
MLRHVFAAATVLLMSAMLSASQAPQPTSAPTAKPEEGIPIYRCDRAEGVRPVPSP